MPAALIKRLSNLLCVKSIVTLILTVVFADLAVTGRISSHDFLTVFSVVIAFYFGTQSERLSGQLEKDTGQNHPDRHPRATSSTIITLKPAAKASTPMWEWRPWDISGIISSTTT